MVQSELSGPICLLVDKSMKRRLGGNNFESVSIEPTICTSVFFVLKTFTLLKHFTLIKILKLQHILVLMDHPQGVR